MPDTFTRSLPSTQEQQTELCFTTNGIFYDLIPFSACFLFRCLAVLGRKVVVVFTGFVSCMLRAPFGVLLLLSHTSCNSEKASEQIKQRERERKTRKDLLYLRSHSLREIEEVFGSAITITFRVGSTAILGEYSQKGRETEIVLSDLIRKGPLIILP